MADREQPYDPYIPSGSSAPGGSATHGGNQRTAALQAVGSPLGLGFVMIMREASHIPPEAANGLDLLSMA